MNINLNNLESNVKDTLKALKSGTDIRGVAIETEEHKISLTCENVALIAYGFSKWIKKIVGSKKKIKISIGIDSRLSGPKLKETIKEILTLDGIFVYDCGISTTPSMFMTTILDEYKCDGAIMITASHLPYYYNGIKFFTSDGGCEKSDIDEIITLANVEEYIFSFEKGKTKEIKLIEDYANLLVSKVREGINCKEPLRGSKIIVDAGNGAGGFFAEKVLKRLGADIEGSQFLEPDGKFPNHIPNPENNEAIDSIKDAVIKSKADLGIIFDTDVDRAAVVSKNGEEINKNTLIALISSILTRENNSENKITIVTDSITSKGLTDFLNNLGCNHHRFKRGYKNVINEAKRLNEEGIDCPLAIETSGHAALRENFFLDDGAYIVVKILIEMAKLKKEDKDIYDLIKYLKHPLESCEKRIKITADNFREYGEKIILDLKEYVSKIDEWSTEPKNYEGIKINCNNEKGWFIFRLSLHEPVFVLNIESDIVGGVSNILLILDKFIKNYNDLVI